MSGFYWILNAAGEPERVDDVLTWGEWFQRASKDRSRILAHDRDEQRGAEDVLVSTVFLGLDHSFTSGPPLLWETMILGGPLDGYQRRYTSRAAALDGHAEACDLQRRAAKRVRKKRRSANEHIECGMVGAVVGVAALGGRATADEVAMTTYGAISRLINREFAKRGEWAGLPMPLPGLGLVVEPKHPAAAMIADMQRAVDIDHHRPSDPAPDPDDVGWRIVNEWRGQTKRGVTGTILILRHEDGRTRWGVVSDKAARNRMLFGPLDSFDAWHLDTELTAIDRLATLVTERQFAMYVLTGALLETSRRSDLTYMFRRCRPTIAMSHHGTSGEYFRGQRADGESMHIVACLCLHPIAYYANTFAGAMVPTDDVIAHLMLMRGDEHLFWRRANQHHPIEPESGL